MLEEQRSKVGPLAVWVHPSSSPARGRVILLHGQGEHSGRHRPTAAALVARGFEVVRFDFRGAGESEGARQWIERFEDYVADVVSVFDWVGRYRIAVPTFLLGHSVGGLIAIYVAEALDGRLAGLLLNAPVVELGPDIRRTSIIAARLMNRVMPRARVPTGSQVASLSRDPAVRAEAEHDPLNYPFVTARQACELLDAIAGVRDRCSRIHVPVLITHGDADRLVRVAGSVWLHEAFGSSHRTLRIIAGGYHELHLDTCRQSYLEIIGGWLEKIVEGRTITSGEAPIG